MEFVYVFIMWTVMMVGMMTPSAAPMIFMYDRVRRHTEAQSTPLGTTIWFVAGYFLVWVAFALLATLVQWALERTALLDPAMSRDAVSVRNAAWWLSPRHAGLPSVRASPWRGLRRLLMALLLGVTNLRWMVLFSLLALLEKGTSLGRQIAALGGTVLVAAGAWLLLLEIS